MSNTNQSIANAIEALFVDGAIDLLRAKLLHSSSWQQFGFTAYGPDQIQTLWLRTFQQVGPCKLVGRQQQSTGLQHALHLSLQPLDDEQALLQVVVTFEANQTHIKKANCILAFETAEGFPQSQLPTPDPQVLSQLDQQQHLHTSHATPIDVCPALSRDAPELAEVVSQWWQTWSTRQLSQVPALYADDAKVCVLQGEADCSVSTLTALHNHLNVELLRNYKQLSSVVFDAAKGQVAVEWMIDADIPDSQQRIRIPVVSLLTIANKTIHSEFLLIDRHMLLSRYHIWL